MADIILEQNSGIEQTNMDGGAFNNFASGNKSGVMRGVLNECRIFLPSSNVIGIDSGEFIIYGIRVKRTEQTFFTLTSTPVSPVRYQIIAEVKVDQTDQHVDFALILRTISPLTQDELYKLGYGTYQIEIMRFTHSQDGITDPVRIIDVITGGSDTYTGLNIGYVFTNTLDPGMDAEVDVENRYDRFEGKWFTDFTFSLPKGKDGMGCYVNGEPTPVYFASDPQSQINDLKQQNTSQSSQIENLGQTDQNLQSQINDLKQPRIERISIWKRKTVEEGKIASVTLQRFDMETEKYWGSNLLLFELRMCCFSGGELNEPTTTYFVARPSSGNAERIPCTCGGNAQELGVFSPTFYKTNFAHIYNYTPYPIYLDEVFVWIQK